MKKILEGIIYIILLLNILGIIPVLFVILTEKFPILIIFEIGFVIACFLHEILK